MTLLDWGPRRVTTVDYNPPLVLVPELRSFSQQSLPALYAEGNRFDMIVAFSGIEHGESNVCALCGVVCPCRTLLPLPTYSHCRPTHCYECAEHAILSLCP